MANVRHFEVEGSEHAAPRGTHIGPAHRNERTSVTLHLRSNPNEPQSLADAIDDIYVRKQRRPMEYDEYVRRYGSTDTDLNAVRDFVDSKGLELVEASSAKNIVTVEGTAEELEKAFGVKLESYTDQGQEYHTHAGNASLPESLRDVVQGVIGLDNRPFAHPHNRYSKAAPRAANGPTAISKRYKFPQGVDYSRALIVVLELEGGYLQSDIDQFFSDQKVAAPNMLDPLLVGKGKNAPTGSPTGPDGEVALDIDVAAGLAPGVGMMGAFAQNTEWGFANLALAAAHFIWAVTGRPPDAISCSWGAPDVDWSKNGLALMKNGIRAAAATGTAFLAASGDNNSTDGVNDGKQHCDYPAFEEYATATGGTSARPASEPVWKTSSAEGTGGGVETTIPVPSYQANIPNLPVNADNGQRGRVVPDVAASADPAYGYPVQVDGARVVYGGTSAAAPAWAAVVAAINAKTGERIGFLNPHVYEWALAGERGTNAVTQGNNGAYSAAPGDITNACCGVGTPDVEELVRLFERSLAQHGRRGPGGRRPPTPPRPSKGRARRPPVTMAVTRTRTPQTARGNEGLG